MKTWISSLLVLSLAFVACSTDVEPPLEEALEEETVESDDLAMVVLAEEFSSQKVSFASEDLSYLYGFEYDMEFVKYLGYPLDGMSENGGAFMVSDGSEIVTSTSSELAVGLAADYGDFVVLESSESKDECELQYRVVELDGENLSLRAKSCEGQDLDSAAKALDMMLWSLTIDEL